MRGFSLAACHSVQNTLVGWVELAIPMLPYPATAMGIAVLHAILQTLLTHHHTLRAAVK